MAIDYNTLQYIKLDKFINIKYLNDINDDNAEFLHYEVNLFGNKINTRFILNKSFTYYDNSIINNSLFCKHFEIKTDNYVYINNYNIFIDLYIIINIIFINYYDIIINNNVRNIINLNVDLNDYISIVKLCNKYEINISNIIKNINTMSDFNKIELNVNNYDIFKKSKDINDVLDTFTDVLRNISNFNNDYIYCNFIHKFLIKLNDKSSTFIIDNLLSNMNNNNIVYDIYKHDYNKLFDDYILNKAFKNNHMEHIKKTRQTIDDISNTTCTYNINLKNIKRYMNFNKKINIHKFNLFIYDFYRYKKLNNLIPENITLSKECDLIKILCIKPKLLFETTVTDIIYDLFYTKQRDNIILISNLMKLSFHILYSMLNTDIESYMLHKSHDFNKINQNSPYIHKLSKMGKHLTTHTLLSYENVYRYIIPITYGYCVNLKQHTDEKKINDEIDYKYIQHNKYTCLSTKSSLLIPIPQPSKYNTPVNSYLTAYDLLIEYTNGLFCKNFNYFTEYNTQKYDINTPKVMLTGSMIGEYCLSSYINKHAFDNSDIDIGVLDPYLIYYVKQNIVTNLKSLNNYNICIYKKFINNVINHKLLNSQFKVNVNNKKIINNILKYIIKSHSNISYELTFPTNNSQIMYTNIHKEITLKPILTKMLNKNNIDNNKIKQNIESFLFNNYEYVQNTKICLNNIYYYSPTYMFTKYRDIDIYISSLTKISLYHEPIVRACYTNGEFLIFTDCLNSIITRTSLDYRAVLGKKTPIDIMLKKHKQCVANRILSNIDKLMDFIIGVSLTCDIYLELDKINDLIKYINNIKNKKNKSVEINIGDQYILTIYNCYL